MLDSLASWRIADTASWERYLIPSSAGFFRLMPATATQNAILLGSLNCRYDANDFSVASLRFRVEALHPYSSSSQSRKAQMVSASRSSKERSMDLTPCTSDM